MAKGDGNDGPGSGSGGGSNANLFTWNGGQAGSPGGNAFGFGETGFKPDEFGKTLGHDTAIAYGAGPKVFDQNLFAGLGPESMGLIQSGLAGPNAQAASGQYLSGGNPFFEQNLQKTLGDVNTQIANTFQGSGRFGGMSHQQNLAETVGNISNQARGANYENEWARMNAAQAQQLGLSGLLDQNAQGNLQGQYDLFSRKEGAPLQHIANYMGLFGSGVDSNAFAPEKRPFANLLGFGTGLLGGLF